MRRTFIILVVAGLVPGAWSYAQETPEDFTPQGYEFCGWRDYKGDGKGWTYDEPEPGVWLRGFASGLNCRTARRHITRLRYSQTPPYRPLRPGYRCKTLDSDHEYSDVRCVRKGGKRKFRFQTGA